MCASCILYKGFDPSATLVISGLIIKWLCVHNSKNQNYFMQMERLLHTEAFIYS